MVAGFTGQTLMKTSVWKTFLLAGRQVKAKRHSSVGLLSDRSIELPGR